MATKKNKKPAAKKTKAKAAPKAKTAAKKQRKVVASAPKQKPVRKTVKNTRANLPTRFDIEQATISVMAREKNRAEYRDALYASSSPFYVGNDFAYPSPAEIWMLLTAFDEGRPLSSVIDELKVAQERTLSSMLPVQINHDARAGTPIGIGAHAVADAKEKRNEAEFKSINDFFEAALEAEKTALTFLGGAGVTLAGGVKSHWMTFALDLDGMARCLWTHDGNRGEPIEFKKKIEKKTDLFELLRNAQRGVAFHIEEIIKQTGVAPIPLSGSEVDAITDQYATYGRLTMACVVNGKPVIDIMDDHIIPIPVEVPAYIAVDYVIGVDGPALIHTDTKVEAAEPLNLSTEPLAVDEIAGLPEFSPAAASVVIETPASEPQTTEDVTHDPVGGEYVIGVDMGAQPAADGFVDDDLPF